MPELRFPSRPSRIRRLVGRVAARLGHWADATDASPHPPTPVDVAAKRHVRHLAHELNNVLAVVLSGADIVEDAGAQPELRNASVAIASAAQDGLDLTARIVAVARRNDLMPLPCDIAGTLAASCARLERAAGGRAALRLELADHVLPALVDRDQFLAAVVELVFDAQSDVDADAIPAGTGDTIVVRTRLSERGAARGEAGFGVTVEIERESAVMAARLARTELSPESSGLALAASFAQSSGGALERIRSGAFSRVALHLPLINASALAQPATPPRPRAAGLMEPARAVVVEDNDFLRGALVRGLRERGLDVAEARDAAEARTLLESGPAYGQPSGAAVLVTDVVLPGDMDGFALARWARSRDPLLALLFVSAFMSARLPAVLASDELASFVRKPIELGGLLAVLDGLLAVRHEQAHLQAEALRRDIRHA